MEWVSKGPFQALRRRRQPAADGSVLLHRGRIYILPTRQGLILALVLFAMLVGAMNYGNSLAYGLTFLLGSMATVSIFHTFRNLHRLQFTSSSCEPVFAGERAVFHFQVINPGEERRSIELAAADADPTVVDLPPGLSSIPLAVRTRHRGTLPIGRVTVSTDYPLGLFRGWAYLNFDTRCVVYPRPAGKRPLPSPETGQQREGGAVGSGSDDFHGLRKYTAGDPLRHIHWKAVARGGALLTKQFVGEGGGDLLLGWEHTAEIGDTEARLSQLCAWVLESERLGVEYTLLLPEVVAAGPGDSGRIGPGHGAGHRARCLAALALFGTKDGGNAHPDR